MNGDKDDKRPQDSSSSPNASKDTPDASLEKTSDEVSSKSQNPGDETELPKVDSDGSVSNNISDSSSEAIAEANSDDDPSLIDDQYAVERGEVPPDTDASSFDQKREGPLTESESEPVPGDESMTVPSEKGRRDDDSDEDSFEEDASDQATSVQGELGGDDPEDEQGEEDEIEEEEDEDDELSSSRMPLTAHLLDLRKRMVRSFLAVAVGFLGCYPFSKELFGYLMAPMTAVLKTSNFIYTYPPEAFFTYIKVSLVAGAFVMSPFIFYQMWKFIAPGLYEHERKVLIPIAFLSAVFFVAGACFGYFVVFPFGFDFFASFSTENIVFTPKLSEYLGFSLKLLFAFGFVFEMPIFVLFLAKLGLCTATGMRRYRKYAILMSFVVSAILTPPDVITQTLMAGPLILLYEISIIVAYIFGKKEKVVPEEDPEEADEAKADESGAA